MDLSHAQLVSILSYDSLSGIFQWRSSGKGKKRKKAGRLGVNGYREIGINGRLYYASRLAWFYVTGAWPPRLIDHKDRNRDNNAFSNLRLANYTQNLANRPAKSMHGKGVRFQNGRYHARITNQYLGSYATVTEAREAFLAAARIRYGDFTCV